MVDAMLKYKGMSGRPNTVTRWYAERHGAAFLTAAWCDMAVTKAAHDSNNSAAVLPGGDRAYTVWHAQDFQRIGRWRTGTAAHTDSAQPGDIVFFDWGGSNSISAIDHVGVVIKALGGGYVQTIEGNTSDACLVKTRHHSVIAGYGRPAYGTDTERSGLMYGLQKGDKGDRVRCLQELIAAAGFKADLGPSGVDGDYGPATAKALLKLRRSLGSKAKDGDKVTAPANAQLYAAVARRWGKV